jgi:hypothetical protein
MPHGVISPVTQLSTTATILDDSYILLLHSTTLDLSKSSNQNHMVYGLCFKTCYSIKLQNCRYHLSSVVLNIEYYLLLSPPTASVI